jgi:uncharacterized protein YjbI with pentapeptide repeats
MANPEHLEILKQGVEQWNKWRERHFEVRPDLRMANLLVADLQEANLRRADLRGASLKGAVLSSAVISASDLSGANLAGAVLATTVLRSTTHQGTKFSGSRLWATLFADVDLSHAKGLENVIHEGPSTIGIDTIYKSRGRIPEKFLRGCGVPDEFIDFISSMTRQAIEFYSCFISYSTNDQEFAERLHADLQAKGVRCWFAPEEMKAGRKVHEQVDEAIRLHDRLLLILSEASMKSEWVKTEIAKPANGR